MDNIVDRIGNYFAQQEVYMQEAIQRAMIENKDLHSVEPKRPTVKSSPKLDRKDAERRRRLKCTKQDNDKLLDMFRSESNQHTDDQQVSDKVKQKRVKKKKAKVKKTGKSVRIGNEKKQREMLHRRKIQEEREQRHAEAFLAIQKRAQAIEQQARRKSQLEAEQALAEKEKIKRNLAEIELARKNMSASNDENNQEYTRSPRVDPMSKFVSKSTPRGTCNVPQTDSSEVEHKPFLENLALQLRDQLHFEKKTLEKKNYCLQRDADLAERAHIAEKHRAKDATATASKLKENALLQEELNRLKTLVNESEQQVKLTHQGIETIRRRKAKHANVSQENRFEQLDIKIAELERILPDQVNKWISDEEQRAQSTLDAREKAKLRVKQSIVVSVPSADTETPKIEKNEKRRNSKALEFDQSLLRAELASMDDFCQDQSSILEDRASVIISPAGSDASDADSQENFYISSCSSFGMG